MLNDWRHDQVQKTLFGIAACSFVILILLINYWLVTGLWTGQAEAWLVNSMFGLIAVAAGAIVCAICRRVYIEQFSSES